MIFEQFDIVLVPFPFADKAQNIRRPALIISGAGAFGDLAGHSVMAMVTSAGHAPWPLDVPLSDLAAAGLPNPSMVRMKLFTLDHRLVIQKRGHLAPPDEAATRKALAALFGTD